MPEADLATNGLGFLLWGDGAVKGMRFGRSNLVGAK